MNERDRLLLAPGYVYTTELGSTNVDLLPASWAQIDQLFPGPSAVGDFKTPLPWNYYLNVVNTYKGSSTYRAPGKTVVRQGFSSNLVDPPYPDIGMVGPDVDQVYNEALSRLSEKVRGSLDLSIALGESGKTARMTRIIKRLREFTAALPTKTMFYKSLGRRAVNMSSNAWLEYNYGWRPLINDLYGVAEESLRIIVNKTSRISASCNKRETVSVDQDHLWYAPEVIVTNDPVNVTVSQGCRVVLFLENKAFDVGRLTSLNPASIAWELTPFSFVADWFIDIGSFLRSVETAILYANRVKSGYYTLLRVSDATCRVTRGGFLPSGSSFAVSATGSLHRVDFRRAPLGGYPLPTIPSFKADLGARRLLSAAALLGQKLRRY